MKLIWTLIFLGFILIPSKVLAEDWQINSFNSEINIFESGTIRIEETINVDFKDERHGIFRYIPIIYKTDTGDKMRLGFDLESITMDGSSVNYDINWLGASQMMMIGDANTYLTGKHEYKIIYIVDRAILFDEGFDEFYWNVTGNDWDVLLGDVSSIINLPSGADIIATACYTGEVGSLEQNCGRAIHNNSAVFTAEDDYLTIAVGFSKGIINEPSILQKILWFLRDNWPVVIPFAFMLFAIYQWWTKGRDPKMNSVIAEYEAPEGVLPVYAGFLAKGMIPNSMFASMIVKMAIDGYLQILTGGEKKRKHEIFLEKIKEPDGLDNVHKILFEALFSDDKKIKSLVELKGSLSSGTIMRIKSGLKRQLEVDGVFVVFSKRRRSIFILISAMLMFVAIYLTMFFGSITSLSFLIGSLVVFIFALFMPKKSRKGIELVRKVLGFKLFIHTAERYRAEWQEKENIFEEVLPYAIAFGEVKHWAKVFKDLEFENPSWYKGATPILSADLFTSSLMSTIGSIQSSVTPASSSSYSSPSSGGSFGGGSSGGGFGGGGGGSW